MCCNKRRGCNRGTAPGVDSYSRPQQVDEMVALKRMVEQLSFELNPQRQAAEPQQVSEVRNVRYTDEAKSEQPPSYDAAISTPVVSDSLNRSISMDNKAGAFKSESQVVMQSYDRLQQALASYRDNGRSGRLPAKRAARALLRDLCEEEIARRRSQRGRLECGERRSIKRELQGLKEEMRNSVWAIKQEHRNRRC